MPDPLPLDERPARPLWRNASFMLMWTSVAASGFGDRLIQLAAEPMLGVNEAGTSAAKINAQINFWFFLPYMLLTLVGGYLADLLPRKWIMFACDEGRGLVLLLALWMAADLTGGGVVPDDHQWKVALILICTGAFAAIFNPARVATVPQIVPGRQLQPANAVIAVIASVASLVGFMAGGRIMQAEAGGSLNIQAGIMCGALAYLISGWFFVFMRPAPKRLDTIETPSRLLAQFAAALGYLKSHRVPRNLVIYNITFWAGAFVVISGISALIKKHYGFHPEDPEFINRKGMMMGVLGGGLMCGSIFVIWLRERRESANVALISLAMSAICMLLLAINKSYGLGLFLTFWCGMFGGIFNICVDTLTQTVTPNYMRGRVFGLRALLNTSAAVLVNYAIWNMEDETADNLIVWVLGVVAAIMFFIAVYGLKVQITSGSMNTWRQNILWKATRLYVLVWHRLKWVGRHHLPHTGRLIIASNHTCAIDPFLIQAMSSRPIRWVMVMKNRYKAARFLWNSIHPICLDEESNLRKQMRTIFEALEEEWAVGIFPEGRLQRESRAMRPFQPGIGVIAKRSGAPIIPVWISGTPQKKRMIWHFLSPSHSKVIVGKPFLPTPAMSTRDILDELLKQMLVLARTNAFGDMSCPACDFDLRGSFDADSNTCPECGHVVWEPTFREAPSIADGSDDSSDEKPPTDQV